jgi:hypothetical protein
MSGLVSTVSLDPPLLRWVFVDAGAFEVRYGGKADSEGHIIGPWLVLWVRHFVQNFADHFNVGQVLDRRREQCGFRKAGRGCLPSGFQKKMLGNSLSTITTMDVDSPEGPGESNFLSGGSLLCHKLSSQFDHLHCLYRRVIAKS